MDLIVKLAKRRLVTLLKKAVKHPYLIYMLYAERDTILNQIRSLLRLIFYASILSWRSVYANEGHVFTWLLHYINERYSEGKLLTLTTRTEVAAGQHTLWFNKDDMSIVPQSREIPGVSSGLVFFGKHPIYFTANPNMIQMTTVTFPWNRNKFWSQFILFIKNYYYESMSRFQMIHYVDSRNGVAKFSSASKNIEAINFSDGNYVLTEQMEELYEGIKIFMRSSEIFKAKKLPYKMSFILQGRPGTGKSEFVKRLASELHLPLYSLNVQNVNDSGLASLFDSVMNGIIIVEEVESFIKELVKDDDMKVPRLVAWHEVLDNIRAQRVLIFFTTNNFRKLKELNHGSFCRPQRIDACIEFNNLTNNDINNLLNKRFALDGFDIQLFEKNGRTLLTVADVTSAMNDGRGDVDETIRLITAASELRSAKFEIIKTRNNMSITKCIS